MKPGKYQFSEPFASWFRGVLEERKRIDAAKADGTYKPEPERNDYADRKAAMQPPTQAQLAYLKKLGAKSIPMSKFEASAMIGELLGKD